MIRNLKIKRFADRNAVLITTTTVMIVFSLILGVFNKNFFSTDNLWNILSQATPITVLAIGHAGVLIAGGIDLSCSSTMALSCLIAGQLMVNQNLPGGLGILLALAIGALAGLFNGFLVTKVKIAPFLATLGTQYLFRGLGQQLVNGVNVHGLPKSFTYLGDATWGPVPAAIVFTAAAALIYWIVCTKTKFGSHMYASGGNPAAARLSGVKTDRTLITAYVICGILAAAAGILVCGRVGSTYLSMGDSYETEAVAACAIGGISLAGGIGSIWGALIGGIFMQVLKNAMNMAHVGIYDQVIVKGAVILAAVSFEFIYRKVSERRALHAKEKEAVLLE